MRSIHKYIKLPGCTRGPFASARRQTPAGHSRGASYILMSDRYPATERLHLKADTIKKNPVISEWVSAAPQGQRAHRI